MSGTNKFSPEIDTCLKETHPTSAYLVGEQSTPIYLEGAHSKSTYLEEAHSTPAYLTGALPLSTYLEGALPLSTYLAGALPLSTYLEGAHSTPAYLTGAPPLSTYLEEAHSTHAYMKDAHQRSTYLKRAHQRSIYLKRAHQRSTYLREVCQTSTYLKGTHLLSTYLVCAVYLLTGVGGRHVTCTVMAFNISNITRLLMCTVLDSLESPQNFTWHVLDTTENQTTKTPVGPQNFFQNINVSFTQVSIEGNRTGSLVCEVLFASGLSTNCSLQFKHRCVDNSSYTAPELEMSAYPVTYLPLGFQESVNMCILSPDQVNNNVIFIPFDPSLHELPPFEYPVKPPKAHPPVIPPAPPPAPTIEKTALPPTAEIYLSSTTTMSHSEKREITEPPGNESAISIINDNIFEHTVTTAATTKEEEEGGESTTAVTMARCVYHKNKLKQNETAFQLQIQFDTFLNQCQGMYIITGQSSVISAVAFFLNGSDYHPHTQDTPTWPRIVAVVVALLVVAAVVAVVVVFKRRKVLRNSRYQHRNKMVSTISGSKVHMFTNMAYSKEMEKSELEEFPRKHIRFLDTIGKGTFGTVVMAEALNLLQKKKGPMSKNWAKVAVKMTLISDRSNEELKSDFLSELALMKTIPPHVNIITLHASCTAHDPYLMILEYARHGDLRKYLLEHRMERNYANAAFSAYGVSHKKERHYASSACALYGSCNKKDKFEGNIYAVPGEQKYTDLDSDDDVLITSRDLLSFALQICRGLEHLTRNRIVHRDVAARNVLLFDHNIVKISDFGLARKVGQGDVYERTRKGLLPIRWMSPESLFYNQFTEKSDVWSYGILLWELITLGSTPYPGLDASTVLEKIRCRDLLVCPPHSATVVNNIVQSCWREDPNARPPFSQLCQELEELLEAEVEYVDLDQMNDHEYSTLEALED